MTGRVPESPSGSADWPRALTQAEAAASERRYADADRMLAEFATRYPATQGAVESLYWRGVFALEPANQDGSPVIAATLFETYGKSVGPLPHRVEADVLRHLALRLQSLAPTAVATSVTSPTGTPNGAATASATDLKAKDTEIQRLKDELAKANDELERIKRRLTAPTKP
jgi:hypothetical protein